MTEKNRSEKISIVSDEVVTDAKKEDGKIAVLLVDGLKKRYGKNPVFAVDGIGFSVYEGEIVGLIGTNGAGKSTTLKSITGFLSFDGGKITILGKDIEKEPVQAKRNFGYVPDDRAMFEKMTGTEYLNFVADIRGVPIAVRKARTEEFQQQFRLGDKIDNLISSYSHGMRQKICLMASLIHRPKLWILDEPMTGLDPQTMERLKKSMLAYREAGNAVLFSSHNLEVVEKICDRVVMIKDGRKILDGTVAEIVAAYGMPFADVFLSLVGEL